MTRLFLEQNPPSEAVHATVVGFIVLIFIVARVLTTRGFAAFRPGINLRAIVTWLAVVSLTLMVIYSALLARLLFTQSMAGSYQGPKAPETLYDPPSSAAANMTWPLTIEFQDMSVNKSWNVMQPTDDTIYSIYYILAMKPTALYPGSERDMLFALRIILRLSQCGLMSSLLLLNTYWCQHVEVLVDEGNFMSKSEMFMYWVFAGVVLVLPMAVLLGIGFGKSNWGAASNVSDVCLLLLGLVVIVGYILTCRRLQALERDSRNVNGGDTSTTLQLAYYIYCVYWLLGSFGAIIILGVLYKLQLVDPSDRPVLAQAINDLQSALWSTLIIMVYPAAMFLLYPSVDVLTHPENDPGSRFQKRDKKSVKDAKRIRESLYLDGDASNSVENHSSLHGLTSRPSLTLQQQQHVQKQILHDQQQFINYRRERMGSLTAAVNEMQLIEEEESRTESIEMKRQPSVTQKSLPEEAQTTYKDRSWGDKADKTDYQYGSGTGSYMVANPNVYETNKDAKMQWMTQHSDMDREGLIANLEITLPQDQQQLKYTWSKSPSPTMSPTSTYETSISMDTATTPSNAGSSSGVPAPASAHATTTSSTSKSTPIKPLAPLTGILKTRNSTGSTRSSVGQNPFELTTLASPRAPLSHVTPVYGSRTSSVQPQTVASPRRSSENAPIKRRASNPGKPSSSAWNPASDSPSPSPSVQQRRSNVTARVDASALALAAQQQSFQHHPNLPSTPPFKSRTSRDGSEGVEIDYFGIQSATADTPYSTSTPTEVQQLSLSPPITGFLMADPYPSAGTRFDQDISTTLSLSDPQEDAITGIDSYSKRSGSSGSSKKYKAPPPPIPTGGSESSTYRATDFRSSIPTTPTTPTTPPGVRPRRSVDAVVDRRLLEMAGRMYEDHVVPAHILQSASAKSSPHSETPPTPTTSAQPQQPTEPVPPPPPRTMSPPIKSPHRARESFENTAQGSQDPATPPSPASTASPTIQSSSTLPRPLTPAWYESKTNFSSTNEVLNHYNAVMRGGSFHKQEQQQLLQQQQQQQQQHGRNNNSYYSQAVGPLDTVGTEYTYTQTPTIPAPIARPPIPQQYPLQERMGSADSFGVVRRSSSSRKPFETDNKTITPPIELSLTHQVPHRLQPQVDRHSFMMPSESISVYSTWTGDLSDVTNTSGEVSVGAFADRKSSAHYHPKGSSGGSSDKGLADHSDEHDVRKSQASAYSIGSSFGAGGSSPRQSAGGYSNYSNNSGPLNVTAALASAGALQLPQGSPSSGKRHSGSPKKRGSSTGSGSGHSSFTGSSGNGAAVVGTPIANKMNMMRLSAFGPGEEDVDVGSRRERGSDAGVGAGREFYLEETDPTSEELEKVIQQEWMDRRAAVKKDSKSRLEQLQKQQALEDQRREQEQREQQQQQQVQDENVVGRRHQGHMEEPYSLNSVYFKSSAELQLGLSDPSLSSSSTMVSSAIAEPRYMFARQAQNSMSSQPETSGESVTNSSVTTVTTPTTAATTPSPHPSQPSSRPPTVSPTQPFFPPPTLSRTDIQTQDNSQGAHDEEVYIRSPTYGSPYANHQNQLYYDSVDSIATLRDNRGTFSSPTGAPGQFQHRHQLSASSSPSPIGPISAAPSPTPSFSSASQRYQRYQQQQSALGSTSPTPLSSYPVYQHTPGSPTSPRSASSPSLQPYYASSSPNSPTGASLTVLGPSQYRITTAAGGVVPSRPGHPSEDGDDVGNGSRSPVQRTSSRLTNLTSAESEYQWESAELNHHRWEMLENNNNTHHRK